MFKIGETGHEIMGDRSPRRILAQDVHLKTLKLPHHLRAKASKIQGMGGVRVSRCSIGQLNFVEVPIFHAPEHIAPRLVQARDLSISLSKPPAELYSGRGREGNRRVMTAVLVVDL